MRAMILRTAGQPLEATQIAEPAVGADQVALRVAACGVCRTDLHVRDGELAGELSGPKLPLVLGHQIVGQVVAAGERVTRFKRGDRVGVPWLGWTDGSCRYCLSGRENLCPAARFTGYHLDGGFAEVAVADARYCFGIPAGFTDEQAAPLLCGGLIGYRALRLAGEGSLLGLYGFGASAHLVAQVARHRGWRVLAFTRPGDRAGQEFARSLGAEWAGSSEGSPPEPLDAALIFAPVGLLVPRALAATRPGGTVVCAGIHMSDIPSFPYELLWGERTLRSVANLTRTDGEELLALAPQIPIRSQVEVFPLAEANAALDALAGGKLTGAAVLSMR